MLEARKTIGIARGRPSPVLRRGSIIFILLLLLLLIIIIIITPEIVVQPASFPIVIAWDYPPLFRSIVGTSAVLQTLHRPPGQVCQGRRLIGASPLIDNHLDSKPSWVRFSAGFDGFLFLDEDLGVGLWALGFCGPRWKLRPGFLRDRWQFESFLQLDFFFTTVYFVVELMSIKW